MMRKKKHLFWILAAVISVTAGIGGCLFYVNHRNEKEKAEIDKVIRNKLWCRSDFVDGNNLYFGGDGDYGYWCNCGNGVDGHDVYDQWEFMDNPYKIKVKSSNGKQSEMIKIISYSDNHLILNISGKTVGFEPEEEYKWPYPKKPVSTFVEDYTGIYEILTMDQEHIEFTVPGRVSKNVLGELPVSKNVELKELVADTPSAEIYEETEAYNIKRADLSWEEAVDYVKEPDWLEILFCDEDGVVEKILFYKMVDENGVAL